MTRATYEPTGEECWINMDYVIDAYPLGNKMRLYTIDRERGSYLVNREAFEFEQAFANQLKF